MGKPKNKYVAITPKAYKVVKDLVSKDLKEDGSEKTMCEVVSTIIVRAASK